MDIKHQLLQTVSGTYTSQGVSEAIEVTVHPDRYEFQTSRTTVQLNHMRAVSHDDDTDPDCVIQFPIVFPVKEEGQLVLKYVDMTLQATDGLVEHFVLVDPQGITVQFPEEFSEHIYRFFPVLFPGTQPACCAYCKWHLDEPDYHMELKCVRFLKHDPERLQKVLSATRYKDIQVRGAFWDGEYIRENYHCDEFEWVPVWPFDFFAQKRLKNPADV